MASSGKKKKTSWKPVPQDDFIEISSKRKIDWAEEVDRDTEIDSFDSKPIDKVVLPSAPRASCAVQIDESKVPHVGPFQAHVSNIPYDLTENELRAQFADLNVRDIRLPRDEKIGNRVKGFGYVEFHDRGSLIAALRMGETVAKGRSIRIELCMNDGSGRGGAGRSRGGARGSDMMAGPDRTSSNWRLAPREEPISSGFEQRGGGGGGRREYNYNRREESSYDRPPPSSDRFDRGFSGREDRYQRENKGFGFNDKGFRDRNMRDDEGFGRRAPQDDRYSRESGGGSRFSRQDGDMERGSRYGGPRRDEPRPSESSQSSERGGEPKTRQKLVVLPRSANLPPPKADTTGSSASIFGEAKPVDTSAKFNEIEQRLENLALSRDRIGSGYPGRSSSSYDGVGSGSSHGPSSHHSSEGIDKKMEPAPPPKENAWSKQRPGQQPGNTPSSQPINNGTNSPQEESAPIPADERKTEEEEEQPRRGIRPEKKFESARKTSGEDGSGRGGGRSGRGPQASSRPGKDFASDRSQAPSSNSLKNRDSRRSETDEIAKMPKIPDSEPPNFANANKYGSLTESEADGSNE